EYRKLVAKAATFRDGAGPADIEKGIFQVDLAHFDRTDRCVTCHRGLENPQMEGAPQPHAMHPGTYLADHPYRQYGCTICHGGQGRALDKEDAFGRLPGTHWPHPMLEQPYIQSTCGHCHLTIFSGNAPGKDSVERHEKIYGMEVFLRGKDLFSAEGCLGCHRARGVGGILGPDLTEQGEKTRHEYSFQNVEGEQTVSNWLKAHFRDPEMVSPGSRMLKIDLPEHELDALATFVMGLARPEIPFEYFTMTALNEFKGIRDPMEGASGYAALCSACHGREGTGKSYVGYKTGIPAVGNRDFKRVASDAFIRFTLQKGRSRRQMGSWEEAVSGVTDGELDGITGFLKQQEGVKVDELLSRYMEAKRKGVLSGEELFRNRCAACHGDNGTGGVAVALNQEGFLDRAGNSFILHTVIRGRRNTAMPGWPHLEERALVSLLSLIRSWHGTVPATDAMVLPVTDPEEGALKYHFLCSRCHGEFGEGETGPAIINRDFLAVAGDRYLYETIAEGRIHTAMFGWSTDVYNQERLDREDIGNIVGYMRQSARAPLTYIHAGANPGNREQGAMVYRQHCAECHGETGDGPAAPAIRNQELLSAASNGYLMATITLGREGTAMPSWGYGTGSYPVLSGAQRQDLVAFIRAWQRIRIKY
ncbi:MAG TPA: c-type cytochrome, partial [Bacteroides sp.]|nr:c-type cytochrome [Bacteroides sp.]